MKFSIIINCYNTLPLIKKCVTAALGTTIESSEILLINNHPPYPEVESFLKSMKHPRIKVLDPGRNLGCTLGFQYGAERATGEYLVKLDDDTIVPNTNWIQAMYQALKDFPELAYVGLVVPMYRLGRFRQVVKPRYVLEFYEDKVHFACIMIKRSLWRIHFIIPSQSLYGDDEHFYMEKAKTLGMKKGYLVSHQCEHLARLPESDPLYGAWKIFYLANHTRADFAQWRKTFTLGESEMRIFKQFNYPEDQIRLIKTILSKE